jgi:DNA-binding SARP family transcriptional activator
MFCLLGSLIVRRDGVEVTVPRGKQRVILAMLLLNAGRVVRLDQFAEALWVCGPPPSGPVAVQNYVMRLRTTLGDAGRERIITQPGGYLIRVEAAELDVSVFEALLDVARAAALDGVWDQAAAHAREALQLWRGEPLADVDSETLMMHEAHRLAELRSEALEVRIDADLHLGRHAGVIVELQQLAGKNPLRERLHGLLMLALYRAGRQAEALAVYQQVRQVLMDELGTEPGAGLRELHHQMLTADPSLELPQIVRPPTGGQEPVVPRQLPAAARHFTGRARELAELSGLLDEAGQDGPGAVVISAIGGTAGVGKTALALHFARQAAGYFPDGQLYVNLRGFDPSSAPVTPAEAVRWFLDTLSVPPERIPPDADAQAGLYRSLLAGKRMLIVLDNARDEQQARPLLPASPASLVLITSRNQLAGLAATDGARLLTLDILTHDEAVQLLSARIGAARAAAEPEAIGEIATLCAHLPLALAVAAARAAARPRFPLAQLAAELRDTAGRLDALDAGDPAASVRAVFSWSYQQLGEGAARMFRLLGLHPGPDISVPAAGSLVAADEQQARRLLRELTHDSLLTEHAPGRYAFHDLLRAYAAEQARERDTEADRDAAIGRVLDHYLHTAARAAFVLRPAYEAVTLTLAPPAPGAAPEEPADYQQAAAWFDAEHQVLLAAITLATETRAYSHAWQLPLAITAYLQRRGYLRERFVVMGTAVAAATRLDDVRGQATSLLGLGSACNWIGDHDQGRAHLERCIPLYQRLGDRMGEAWALQNLAAIAEAQGRYADSLGHNERALRLVRDTGDEIVEAELLNDIGWCHALLGDYLVARGFCEQSLDLTAKLGYSDGEHAVWDTLGYVELQVGNFTQAAAHFEFALALCRDHGHRSMEGGILSHVGDARHAAGELPLARQAWQQALAIYDEIQHPDADKVRAKLAGTGRTPDC